MATEPLAGNEAAIAWLKDHLRAQTPLVWCGYGLSRALAHALAAIARAEGVHAYAVTPADVQARARGKVAYVSRSGRDPGIEVDFLITQEGRRREWTRPGLVEFVVRDADGGGEPWLPIEYARQTLLTLAASLDITPSLAVELSAIVPRIGHLVLVMERHGDIVGKLFEVSRHKLGPLPFVAIGRDEIGHGFHSRLWQEPGAYTLCCCVLGGTITEPWARLGDWCEKVGVPLHWRFLDPAACEQARVIQLFLSALSLVEAHARSTGCPTSVAGLPRALDDLRDAGRESFP